MDTKEIETDNLNKTKSSCQIANKKHFTNTQRRRHQRKKAAQFKKQSNNKNEPSHERKVAIENTSVDCENLVNKNTPIINNNLKNNLKSSNSDLSASIVTIVDSRINTMEQNKSKDEVKAAREEKKKLKQLGKLENKSKIEGKQKTETVSQTNDISIKNKESPVNKVIVNANDQSKSNLSNHVSNEKSPDSKTVDTHNDKSNSEKSRDEIKAEREAKKLAKQLVKNKSKSKLDTSSVTAVEENLSALTIASPKTEEVKKEVNVADNKKTVEPDKINKVDLESKEAEKSKSELKAERRAKQEAQRAAKTMLQSVPSPKAEEKKKQTVQQIDKSKLVVTADLKKSQSQSPDKSKAKHPDQHKVKLFDHLYTQRASDYLDSPIPLNSKDIHPAIVRLGVQYASRVVMGSNARCIALLNALKQVIFDYNLPSNVEFARGLEAHLKPCMKFLDSCRLPAVSMTNALNHIKWQLRHLPNNIGEYEAKKKLHEAIDTYVKEQIEVAGQAISIAVRKKISDGDVILTYGCSSLIEKIITEAAVEKRFRVVIVAAHPWNEGRELLRRLTVKGVKCSLIMISGLSFIMREINKVLLGAGALLANGYVMARAGTAQVAMVAHAHNVPVLVCCETHKFSERVQTDSIVYNEISNPDDLINCDPSHKEGPLANWRTNNSLTLLNLTYDVTPPDLVTAVVTELAILPCTSVPVILRIKPSEFSI